MSSSIRLDVDRNHNLVIAAPFCAVRVTFPRRYIKNSTVAATIERKMVGTGMRLEAWIAQQPGIRIVCGANGPVLTALFAGAKSSRDCCGLISFGVAGGLAPNLRPGTWIVGSEVLCGESRFATDKLWSKHILAAMPDAIYGTIAGTSSPLAQPDAKAALHIKTGAVAADMESHIVANVATAHRLPMVAVRVIIDPAEHTLPSAAVVSLCSDGTVDIVALMRLVIECPGEFPDLLRTALYALLAGTALVRGRRILQSHIPPMDGEHETVSVETALSKSLEANTVVSKGAWYQGWLMGGVQ
jgi:hopanoid-associated phosphorylase